MQLAGASFCVDPPPVVDPVGRVRALLDLGQHDPLQDRVHRPGGNEHGVARRYRNPVETATKVTGRNCVCEGLSVGAL